MANFKMDSGMAGAFLNVYMPIGPDPVVKDLQGDADLYEDRAYVLRACEYCRQTDKNIQYISIDDMMLEADVYLTKHYYGKSKM